MQAELGDIVYVELPQTGDKLERNEGFGVVESVKAASDVYMPVSGEVTETNGELEDNPSLVRRAVSLIACCELVCDTMKLLEYKRWPARVSSEE